MTRALLATAAAGLALPQLATAHVSARPDRIEQSVPTRVVLDAPNERPGHVMTRLAVESPGAVEIVAAAAPPGWAVTRAARRATWSGGRVTGDGSGTFPLELKAIGPAATYALTVRQGYEDGIVVRWATSLTVIPASGEAAPSQHVGRALVATAVGLTIVLAGLLLRRLRGRSPLKR